MNFEEFYQTHFPPELKPCFEDHLTTITGWQFMASSTKLQLFGAFIAGYTASIKHRVELKRMMLDRVYEQIDQAIEAIEPETEDYITVIARAEK